MGTTRGRSACHDLYSAELFRALCQFDCLLRGGRSRPAWMTTSCAGSTGTMTKTVSGEEPATLPMAEKQGGLRLSAKLEVLVLRRFKGLKDGELKGDPKACSLKDCESRGYPFHWTRTTEWGFRGSNCWFSLIETLTLGFI